MQVLDKGSLDIVDWMGSDATVAACARVSFNNDDWNLLDTGARFLEQSPEVSYKDARLINYLAKHKHVSPFYHPHVTFRWRCPISVQRQVERHRVGTAMNSESTRYSVIHKDFYVPSEIRAQSKSNKQGSEGVVERNEDMSFVYRQACSRAFESYTCMLDFGVAKEIAREVLPLCTYTSFVWTASLAAIAHFIKLRDEDHAQYEVREYAKAMRQLATPLFPHSMEALLSNA